MFQILVRLAWGNSWPKKYQISGSEIKNRLGRALEDSLKRIFIVFFLTLTQGIDHQLFHNNDLLKSVGVLFRGTDKLEIKCYI